MKKLIYASMLLVSSHIFAGTITGIDAVAGGNNRFNLVFKNADAEPVSFNTNAPTAIILDFPRTTSALPSREVPINANGIFSVDVIPGDDRTRAVVNLSKPMSYNVSRVGKDIYLSLPLSDAAPALSQNTSAGLFNIANAAPQSNFSTNATAQRKAYAYKLVPTFHKNGKKGGLLSFKLPDKDTYVNLKQEGGTLVATISDYKPSRDEERRLDVADYATPVMRVDITGKQKDTKIEIYMGRNPYDYKTYQNGDIYNIEISEPDLDSFENKAKELTGFAPNKVYTGEPLSLNFQDIEVRAVLNIIAEFTQQNIVVSDTVSGNITLRLDNVPWDQALDIIMKTKGLAKRENGNDKTGRIIYIAPEKELDTAEIDALEGWQKKQQLMPMQTDFIRIKYAKASDLQRILEKSREISSDGTKNGILAAQDAVLSARGSVTIDERMNALIVSDIPAKIQAVRDLVARLDESVRQVLVDARLVVTQDNFGRDLGARFGLKHRGTVGSNPAENRLGVNLLTPDPKTPMPFYGINILGSDVLVDLELQALQSEGRSELLSSPRVVTQDGNKATVMNGQEIPYSTLDDKGNLKIEYKEALLSLDVTPRVTPNDRVNMEIEIKKDRVNWGEKVMGQPAIDKNLLKTKVEVANGETIVLGGIYEQEQSINENKVPLLGDIPVVGNVFKNTNKKFTKNELLIFITPRVIDQRLTDSDKFSNLRDN
ncbi:type IV pilus secretin PilQ [Dichelobacter nodosus]|uniref:type IV pilus secretin PilQ n=2 Tax=Dichelobacter nodosus TaxID=870 RepID=UPI00107ECD3A|nr:type IV pilus secretin PilQ [Dichelobacter nodosus]TGA65458.1 type IV pilus secretin PilQ [Dichelobacter nodosus]